MSLQDALRHAQQAGRERARGLSVQKPTLDQLTNFPQWVGRNTGEGVPQWRGLAGGLSGLANRIGLQSQRLGALSANAPSREEPPIPPEYSFTGGRNAVEGVPESDARLAAWEQEYIDRGGSWGGARIGELLAPDILDVIPFGKAAGFVAGVAPKVGGALASIPLGAIPRGGKRTLNERDVKTLARAEASHLVKDQSGEPRVFYHGTKEGFAPGEFRENSMFSASEKYAADRAAASGGDRVIPVHLDIRNPADLRAMGISPSDPKFPEIAERLKAEGYDGAQYRDDLADTSPSSTAWVAFSPDQIHPIPPSPTTLEQPALADIVYHGGDLDAPGRQRGLVFASRDMEQAQAYVADSGEQVQSLHVDFSTIASEDDAKRVMGEFGITPTDAGWTLEDSSLYELLDPTFEQYIGDGNVDAFRASMVDQGYTGVRFLDQDIRPTGTGRQTAENVALFEESLTTPRAEASAEKTRVASFFSGTGTVEGAMPDAESVHAVEFMPAIVESFNKAHGTNYKPRSVFDVDPEEVAKANPHLFHASPVCKNLSKIKRGAKPTVDDMRSAESVASVVEKARPPVVTVENVPGYIGTPMMDKITKSLDDAGYTYSVDVIDPADYGGAQTRPRMILRAVRDGELPPLPEKTGPADWFESVADLLDEAPDSQIGPDELRRIQRYVDNGRLDPSKPIITMGESASKDVPYAANAGGPSPTLLASDHATPRILLPDGTTKKVTPRMMARLMGLPDEFKLPEPGKRGGFGPAKIVMGNGIHGDITRQILDPLTKRAVAPPANRGLPLFQVGGGLIGGGAAAGALNQQQEQPMGGLAQ